MNSNSQNAVGVKYHQNRRSIRLKGYDYSQAGAYFITICCQDRKCRFGNIENDKMVLNDFGLIAYNEWIKLSDRYLNFELDVFQIMPNHMHAIVVLNDVGAGFTPAQYNGTNDKPAITNSKGEIGDGFTPAQYNGTNDKPAITNNKGEIDDGFTPAQNDTIGINDISKSFSQIDINNDGNSRAGVPLEGVPLAGAPLAGASPANTVCNMVGAYKSLVANNCLDIFKLKWAGVKSVPYMGKLWQRNYYEHIIRDEQSYQKISDYIIHNPSKWNDDKFFYK